MCINLKKRKSLDKQFSAYFSEVLTNCLSPPLAFQNPPTRQHCVNIFNMIFPIKMYILFATFHRTGLNWKRIWKEIQIY